MSENLPQGRPADKGSRVLGDLLVDPIFLSYLSCYLYGGPLPAFYSAFSKEEL